MEGNGEISDTDSGIILNSGKSTSSFLILTFTGRLILHLTLAQESLKHFFLEVKASSFLALHHAKNVKVVGFEVSCTVMRNQQTNAVGAAANLLNPLSSKNKLVVSFITPQFGHSFLINIHRKTSMCEGHDLKRPGHVTNKM